MVRTYFRAGATSLVVVTLVLISFAAIFAKAPTVSGAVPTAGIAIPLYTDPSDSSWNAVIQAKIAYPNVPFIAIVNPNDWPDSAPNPAYVSGIRNLQAAGVEVLGYVDTSYGTRSVSAVQSDIGSYTGWYSVNGIFLDEMNNVGGGEGYYFALNSYVHSAGMSITFGNPGTSVPASYIGTTDTLCIYENNGLPSLSSITYTGYSSSNFYVIALGASLSNTFLAQAANFASWFYLTDATGSNPYNVLPSYFTSEVAALSNIDSNQNSNPVTTTSTTTTTTSATSMTTPASQSVSVTSVDLSGNSVLGMWATWSQGSTLSSGFTPVVFNGLRGNTYVLTVANYQNYVFCHWQDGNTNSSRTLTLTGDIALSAYYSTAGACPSGTTSTSTTSTTITTSATTSTTTTTQSATSFPVTIQSYDLTGVQFTGMWVTVVSGGTTVASGYTTLTFTAQYGVTYTITVSDYQNYIFQNWDDGSTSHSLTITPMQATTLTAFYSTN